MVKPEGKSTTNPSRAEIGQSSRGITRGSRPPLPSYPSVVGRTCPKCGREMKWRKCPKCKTETLCLACHLTLQHPHTPTSKAGSSKDGSSKDGSSKAGSGKPGSSKAGSSKAGSSKAGSSKPGTS